MQTRESGQLTEADSATQRRIVAAARTHFLAHGFRGVTMDDLAVELGMSKKTLYAHFVGKDALVQAVLLEKFRELEAEVAGIAAGSSADFITALQRFLLCVQRHAEEVRPPFVRDMQRESPDLFKIVEQRRRDIIRRSFAKIMGDGSRAGFVRQDVPFQVIIDVLLSAVQSLVNPPRLMELGLTPQTALKAIITIVLEGALTPEGRLKL